MVKSKNHPHRIPRGKRGDGRKKALKEKQPVRKRNEREEKKRS